MIKKIIKLKGIGKFIDYSAVGEVELRKLNLIFAENGRGKTTICDVLRSLQSGSADYLLGRKTLGNPGETSAQIRLEGSVSTFANGTWNTTYPDIVSFDSTFVHQNVYAGDHISVDQRRNLYQVIVGEEGVKLAQEVDRLDETIRTGNASLNQKKAAVQALAPRGMTAEAFLALPKGDAIDAKIAESKAQILALDRAADIRTRGALGKITLPVLPNNFLPLLGKTLEHVAAEAEQLIRKHLNQHTRGAIESWVAQGVGYAKADICPLCAQSIEPNRLFEAYRSYFSASYAALKNEIATLATELEKAMGSEDLLQVERTLVSNSGLFEFWRAFVTQGPAELSFDTELRPVLTGLRDVARGYVQRKLAALLESIEPGADFTEAMSSYERAQAVVADYNARIDAVNVAITEKKRTTAAGDIMAERQVLTILEATKARHEDASRLICDEYLTIVEEKRKLDEQKALAKTKLDEYTTAIFTKYQGRINYLLDRFGTGFRITNTGRTYAGGRAASSYQILINDTAVDLGDVTSPVGVPSFRNTLSAGDRSTLGLAFFLAQLQEDQGLANKVVVFDDPFNSQDRFRRTCTQQLIKKLGGACKQVIVLSHDPGFLKLIWDNAARDEVRTLQFSRAG